MAGDDPSENDGRSLLAEEIGRQTDGRRYGGDPVQTIKDGEQREALEVDIETEGEIDKRQPAQAVVPGEQMAIVKTVGEPAG